MPKISSKHGNSNKVFSIDSFDGGYTEEVDPSMMTATQLSDIINMKYVQAGNKIHLRQRQGTTKVSNTAITGTPVVSGVTYYVAKSLYILATSTKLFYLDGTNNPQEVGTNILEGNPTFTEFNGKLIIHDSGVTKFYDGEPKATAVEDTNYGKIHRSFADEVLATGNGSTTSYSGTLDNPPLVGSTLSITFTASTTKTITDDGIGRLTGNVPSASAGSGIVENVVGAVDNGSGLIRLTVTGTGFSDGDEVNVQDVGGVSNATNTYANPTWTVTGKTANTIDLAGSTFAGAYTSGGSVSINAISNYTTGAYVFNTDTAPDDGTSVLAAYDKKYGAAKSNAGLVRGSRLYTWVDSDNPSRLTYSEVNDEKATDTSTGGGYLDVDPNDGYDLMGAINFQTSMLLGKENSLHRIDGYPDDDDFRAEKLTDEIGCISYHGMLYEGNIVSIISKNGWIALHPSQIYGNVQKGVPLSKEFSKTFAKHGKAASRTAYNHIDNQLWLLMSSDLGSAWYTDVYVICLDTGGQLTKYRFFGAGTTEFARSFASVNGEFLIGSDDGNLWKLDNTYAIYQDGGVEINDVFFQTGFNDFGYESYSKHCKRINVKINKEKTFDLTVYRDIYNQTTALFTETEIASASSDLRRKFQFDNLLVKVSEIEDAAATFGAQISGIDFEYSLIGKT